MYVCAYHAQPPALFMASLSLFMCQHFSLFILKVLFSVCLSLTSIYLMVLVLIICLSVCAYLAQPLALFYGQFVLVYV